MLQDPNIWLVNANIPFVGRMWNEVAHMLNEFALVEPNSVGSMSPSSRKLLFRPSLLLLRFPVLMKMFFTTVL
jgi:hypothetical protein